MKPCSATKSWWIRWAESPWSHLAAISARQESQPLCRPEPCGSRTAPESMAEEQIASDVGFGFYFPRSQNPHLTPAAPAVVEEHNECVAPVLADRVRAAPAETGARYRGDCAVER